MWVIPAALRTTFSASFPAAEDSTSESPELFQMLERSVSWRGKATPAQSWKRAWRKAPWLRRLSGLMLSPSTADRGVGEFIASLEALPVRTSRSQENAPGSTENEADSSGSSSESSEKSDPPKFFGKMSAGQLLLSLVFSMPSLRSDTPAPPSRFVLLTWAPRTSEPVSSSSVVRSNWPTPATRDAKGANGPEHLAKARGHHDQLPNAVVLSGLRAPEETGAASTPASTRLNPAFVEWLMGWPEGHSVPYAR